MRTGLAPLNGKKTVFFATFRRFGWRKFRGQYLGKTLLFVDIRDKNKNIVCDHIWFKMTKGFEKLGLKPRDDICFVARVDTYARGGRDSDDYDFHLEYAERLMKVNDGEQLTLETI